MRLADMIGKACVIWGTGKEGQAAAKMLAAHTPAIPFTFIDEQDGPETLPLNGTDHTIHRGAAMADALNTADIIIKSPGVSLYHPGLAPLRIRGVPVTSLLNMWLYAHPDIKVLLVTGTKGKSTTATLLAHTLTKLGKRTAVMGNIGAALGVDTPQDVDYLILETSSYQAATMTAPVTVAVMTSLYPEHLDWHTSLNIYYRDKANALRHAGRAIIAAEAYQTLRDTTDVQLNAPLLFNTPVALHAVGSDIYNGPIKLGSITHPALSRHHNMSNVCAVLAVLSTLDQNLPAALKAMADFEGLPHRLMELGSKAGVLYIDDSISTTPESTIAALNAYAGRPVALIAGGHDRGLPYDVLVTYITTHADIQAVLCLGESGQRLATALTQAGYTGTHICDTMDSAVDCGRKAVAGLKDPAILLSPAASSFGMFKDYTDRAAAFSRAAGFKR
ncbi:MAG: UDP-N-acetylmuramoyl-L-alanine--D-glutamate ligase [Pseudomonadota bacterium]